MSQKPSSLHINFASPDWRSLLACTPLWVPVAALVSLILIGTALVASRQITEQLDQVQLATSRMTGPQLKAAVVEVPIPEARALAINRAIGQLNLPWSDLFDAVEQATPANVALVTLEPDARRQMLKGEAEALTSDDMLAYIERLRKTPAFVSVALTKHAIDEQDPFKPFRFSFEAQWWERWP